MNVPVVEAINRQINSELSASYSYLAMSAWCEGQKFTGAARWLRLQSQEEYMHAMKLFDFILARDAKVDLKPLEKPRMKFKSLAEVFERALEQEQEVSRQIDALYETAFKEKAFAAVAELQWFLTEQVEEEKTGREIVAKFQLIGERPGVHPRHGSRARRAQRRPLRSRVPTPSRHERRLQFDAERSVNALCVLAPAVRAEPPPPAAPAAPPPAAASNVPRHRSAMPKIESAAGAGPHQDAGVRRVRRPRAGNAGRRTAPCSTSTAEFKKLGLKPGNTDGTLHPEGAARRHHRHASQAADGHRARPAATFKWRDDVVAWTKHVADGASIENSDLVFAGYGVTAPEYNWDDFKGVDVKGKTIVVLVNDPAGSRSVGSVEARSPGPSTARR